MPSASFQPPHPEVDRLLRSLRKATDGSSYLPAPEIEAAKRNALALTDPEELYRLLQDWLVLTTTLADDLGAPESARELLDVAGALSDRLLEAAGQRGRQDRDRATAVRDAVKKQQQALQRPGGAAAGLAPSRPGVGVGFRKK